MKTNFTQKLTFLFQLFLYFFFCGPTYAQCPKLVWADEFDGTALDATKWSYQVGNGCDLGSCGWGNNELQYYTDRNVTVSDGNLVITARKEQTGTNEYTSSRIRTMHKGDFLYGRMEARMKLPIGKGIWPAFWMMPTDEVYGAWPQSGEVDIMEYRGSDPKTNHGTIHYGGLSPENKNSSGYYQLPNGQLNDGFHVYAIEWEPNQIRWYIDGTLYSVKTAQDIAAPYKWPFDQKFHLILNVAVGGNYDGSPDASTVFPQSLLVDYVRVYDTAAPAIEGPDLVQSRTGASYTVAPLLGASYTWRVPAGAVITAGQGTNSIQVAWGETPGEVKVSIDQACGTREYAKLIYTNNLYYDLSFLDFEEQRQLKYLRSNGLYEPFVQNQHPSAVNESPLTGKYTRNSAVQYDVLSYQVSQITDAGAYASQKKKLLMDVYTAAPLNTLIVIYLNNSAIATGQPHPVGRHSYYVARTTKQNAWERLEFVFGARLDTAVHDHSIDNYHILFASDSYTGHTYFIDNIDSYSIGMPSNERDGQAPSAPTNLILTGRTDKSISLAWTASTDNTGVTGYDIFRNGTLVGSTINTGYTDEGLTHSTSYAYTVKAKDAAGNSSAASNSLAVTTDAPPNIAVVKVEAEAYTAMRNVITQACADEGGGQNIASLDNRDYADYRITVPATGTYQLDFRVASTVSTGKFEFRLGNTRLASINVPNTGSGQSWITVSAEANLTGGTHTFRILGTGNTASVNWFSLTATGATANTSAAFKRADGSGSDMSALVLFPNPAFGTVNIHGPTQDPIASVEIVSSKGTLRTVYPNEVHVKLSLEGVASGLYLVKIKQSGKVTTRRLMVQ